MQQRTKLFSLCLIVIGLANPSISWAGLIQGEIKLEPLQTRRSNPRYGAADMSMMGPPAPFVGVVYLTKEEPIDFESSDAVHTLSQRGLQFYPAVLPISVGSTVSFPNEDNTYHNVFSYSPEKRFDLGRYAKDTKPPEVVFDQPGQIRLFCEVHEHMRAVILVLETPYFSVTDDAGKFELKDIPEGEYTLNIWRVNRPLDSRPIQVGSEPLTIQ